MQSIRSYMTGPGWSRDLQETGKDFKDIYILLMRYAHFSDKETSGEYINRRFREKATWFLIEEHFALYSITHKPAGPCVIDNGKKIRMFDDTGVFKELEAEYLKTPL